MPLRMEVADKAPGWLNRASVIRVDVTGNLASAAKFVHTVTGSGCAFAERLTCAATLARHAPVRRTASAGIGYRRTFRECRRFIRSLPLAPSSLAWRVCRWTPVRHQEHRLMRRLQPGFASYY